MSVDSSRLSQVVSHVAITCGMKKWHYVNSPLSETFENYFGELVPVIICDDDDKEFVLKVLIKFAPLIHELRECGVVNHLYCKEVYFYTSLVADFEDLNTNVNISGLIPKCYFSDTTAKQEVLVLKDMRCEGFVRYDNGMFMDVEHVKISLEALAKFHALSFMLQAKKQGSTLSVHNTNLKSFGLDDTSVFRRYMRNGMNKAIMMFEGTKYKKIMIKVRDNFENYLLNEVTMANCWVYGHGDVWKENILFQYEDGKPQQACLIDFQQCRIMSPAYDVLYFLLNSIEASTRRKNFQQFLYTYYDTLQRVLRENDLDAQALYSEKELEEDLKSVSTICFPFIQFAFSLWLGLDGSSLLTSKSSYADQNEEESKKCHYMQIIMDIIDDLQQFELL